MPSFKKIAKKVEKAVSTARDQVDENLTRPIQKNAINPGKKILRKGRLHGARRKARQALSNITGTEEDIKQTSETQESILTTLEREVAEIEIIRGSEGAREKAVAKAELEQSPFFDNIDKALDTIDQIETEIEELKQKMEAERSVISGAPDTGHGGVSRGKDALSEIQQCNEQVSKKQQEVLTLQQQTEANAASIRAEIERIKKIGQPESQGQQLGSSSASSSSSYSTSQCSSSSSSSSAPSSSTSELDSSKLGERLVAATQTLSLTSPSPLSSSEQPSSSVTYTPTLVVTMSGGSSEQTPGETPKQRLTTN